MTDKKESWKDPVTIALWEYAILWTVIWITLALSIVAVMGLRNFIK